jgi:hypothetical protein
LDVIDQELSDEEALAHGVMQDFSSLHHQLAAVGQSHMMQ